jgi:hypothetical protein
MIEDSEEFQSLEQGYLPAPNIREEATPSTVRLGNAFGDSWRRAE